MEIQNSAKERFAMGCFYCDEHNEAREAIMMKVGNTEGKAMAQ